MLTLHLGTLPLEFNSISRWYLYDVHRLGWRHLSNHRILQRTLHDDEQIGSSTEKCNIVHKETRDRRKYAGSYLPAAET